MWLLHSLVLLFWPASQGRLSPLPERAFYDSLFTRLDSAQQASDVQSSWCTNLDANGARLCQGLLSVRLSELSGANSDARRAEVQLERAVLDQPQSAVAWYGLGRVRLQLDRDTSFSRGGAALPIGATYRYGAVAAFLESVRLDNGFGRAISALTHVRPSRDAEAVLGKRVQLLRKVRSVMPASTFADVAGLERDFGTIDSAIALERRGLVSGKVDSGVTSLGLARDLYRKGNPSEGRIVLLRGAATPTAVANAAYRMELAYVASPDELKAWDALAPDRRSAWLREFWQKRDVAEGRKDGARLVEHYKRLEYAYKTFAAVMPETGRQRFMTYVSSGMDVTQVSLETALLDPTKCGTAMAEYAMQDHFIGSHAISRDYKPFQDLIDDRGVVWVRHGPPSARTVSLSNEAAEVWRYDRSPEPLVVQFHEAAFNGAGATTLVTTLVTMAATTRRDLCGAEATLCIPRDEFAALFARKPVRPRTCSPEAVIVVSTQEIQRDHDAGAVAITRATTTDDFPQEFRHPLHPALQIFGLVPTDNRTPRLVVAYALPGEQLTPTPAHRGIDYPIALQLNALDANGERHDADTQVVVHVAKALTKGEFASGVVELPVAAGAYHLSFVISQPDGRGAIARLDNVMVPHTSTAPAMGPLVTGNTASGVHWNSGSAPVALGPLDTYRSAESVDIYFQLFGLAPEKRYALRVELFRGDASAGAPPAIVVADSISSRQPRLEVARTLGLQNLNPGRYRIVVTVRDSNVALQSQGWVTVIR